MAAIANERARVIFGNIVILLRGNQKQLLRTRSCNAALIPAVAFETDPRGACVTTPIKAVPAFGVQGPYRATFSSSRGGRYLSVYT
jgi:hypothetical protein